MIKLDVINSSKRISVLNKIDNQEIAEFNGEPFFAVTAIADVLKIPERDMYAKINMHENICVDLEFLESESTHVVHDGYTATGRPLVMGLSWRGLQMICAEFDGEEIRALARDILIVDYIISNPRSLAHYFAKKSSKPTEVKTTML